MSCFTGASLLGMVCIISLHDSLVLHYWAWFVLFYFMLQWFIINGHGLYCSTSLTCSSLPGMVCIVSLDASLVHYCWASFELLHFILHWFILTGHSVYCFNSLSGSSSLENVCIVSHHVPLVHHIWARLYYFTSCFMVHPYCGCFFYISLYASLVRPYSAWLVLFHFILHCFIIVGRGWYYFIWYVAGSSLLDIVLHWLTSCFTVSVLLGMACIGSLPTLVHHYCACFVLFHFMFHWFFLTGYGLYCFISLLTVASLLGMLCIVSLHTLLVLSYWAWLVLFHFMIDWFFLIRHRLYYLIS